MSKGKVLANCRISILAARGRVENGNGLPSLPRKRQREAIIGDVQRSAVLRKETHSLAVLALSDLHERKLKNNLWLLRIKGERIPICRFG